MRTKELIDMSDVLKLLQQLQRNSELTLHKHSEELGVSISTLKRLVRKMRSIGVKIENSGSRRKPSYQIVDWGIINVDVLYVNEGKEEAKSQRSQGAEESHEKCANIYDS